MLLAELVGTDTLRLSIDHPDGVLARLCERVTHALAELRERYALEVSSPGRERPLTKPDHFRRLRRPPRARAHARAARRAPQLHRRAGRRHRREVTVAADTGVVAIAYADIHRSNLVEE